MTTDIGPSYVKRVCDQHAEANVSCDCWCTCSNATFMGHHGTACPIIHPEVPRVLIPRVSSG